MDAFEQIVGEILWREGYWVRTSFKVNLTKDEKRAIGLPSSPRWELDVVAYRAKDNCLKVVECKSYLDSPGVKLRGFNPDHADASRFKLFNKPKLREVVFERLSKQLVETGAARPGVTVQLCLACGHVASERERAAMKEKFAERGWGLMDEVWLHEKLREMSDTGYENQVSAVVAKLIVRGSLPAEANSQPKTS